MIPRPALQKRISDALRTAPITALLGPRQCGKTTIATLIANYQESIMYDMEDPSDHASMSQSPMILLESTKGLVVLDEIQRAPELFPILRVLADKVSGNRHFLILGSASPNLINQASESLAGRVSFIDMSGFNLRELEVSQWQKLWLNGSFPRAFLADDDTLSYKWREDFIRTFLERDIPQMGIRIPASALRRFWTMIAHFHGQIWNASEFARSIGTSEPTARRYLDLLTDAYVVRQLQPWLENLRKRQVKSPKIYIRDSGLLHTLLQLPGNKILQHPKLGSSWEGYVISQILEITETREAYYWATHAGAELDLLLFINGKRVGFEVKFTDAPTRTKSMTVALNDLKLDQLIVVYPGSKSYPMGAQIQAIGVRNLVAILDQL